MSVALYRNDSGKERAQLRKENMARRRSQNNKMEAERVVIFTELNSKLKNLGMKPLKKKKVGKLVFKEVDEVVDEVVNEVVVGELVDEVVDGVIVDEVVDELVDGVGWRMINMYHHNIETVNAANDNASKTTGYAKFYLSSGLIETILRRFSSTMNIQSYARDKVINMEYLTDWKLTKLVRPLMAMGLCISGIIYMKYFISEAPPDFCLRQSPDEISDTIKELQTRMDFIYKSNPEDQRLSDLQDIIDEYIKPCSSEYRLSQNKRYIGANNGFDNITEAITRAWKLIEELENDGMVNDDSFWPDSPQKMFIYGAPIIGAVYATWYNIYKDKWNLMCNQMERDVGQGKVLKVKLYHAIWDKESWEQLKTGELNGETFNPVSNYPKRYWDAYLFKYEGHPNIVSCHIVMKGEPEAHSKKIHANFGWEDIRNKMFVIKKYN